MAYQKTVWKDQDVENPRTYVIRDNGDDTVTLLDAFGEVTELGTPVNASNMNKIENGIADLETYVNTIMNRIYKVGSLYLDTENSATCPIADLIPNSTWELVCQGRSLWGGNGSNANTTIEAGLPNITGTLTPYIYGNNNIGLGLSGCFSGSDHGSYCNPDGGGDRSGDRYRTANLDASSSNSIYGNSTTVQPPAYVVNIWRRTA